MKKTIVIMAAGMGSRFGGAKQLEPLDTRGHTLIEYSVRDAVRAGFRRVMIITREELLPDFRRIAAALENSFGIEVELVIQSTDGITQLKGRTRPLGTAHAVACLEGRVNEPFALINADDYYGPGAYRQIYRFLCEGGGEGDCAAVVYRLKNTLSENGCVSRGICTEREGYLAEIRETGGIRRLGDGIYSTGEGEPIPLDPEAIVSMNFWALTPRVVSECLRGFCDFIAEIDEKSYNVCEFCLPNVIFRLISEGKICVRLIQSPDLWRGMTYREDKEALSHFLNTLSKGDPYP